MADDFSAYGLRPADEPPPPAAPQAEPVHPDDPAGYQLTPAPLTGIDPLTGKPVQSMRAPPSSDPVVKTDFRDIGVNVPAGPGVQAAGSMATDMEQRRRIYASQLYPHMPLNVALSHVFPGMNGRMAAVDPNGQAYYIEPDVSLSRPETLTPRNVVAGAAGLAGPALPAIGGLAGGIAAAPTSVVVGPAGAAAGAGAGDAIRQGIARYFDPTPGATPYNVGQTVGEAAGAGAGQLVGAGLIRAAVPNPLALGAYDLNRTRAGEVLPEANRLNNLAQQQGVQLTPGQASGLPSLLSHEDVIASGSAGPKLTDTAQKRYGEQRNQLSQAFQASLGRVSNVDDKTDASLMFQQGAADAGTGVRQRANALAKDAYDRADATAMPPPAPGQVRPILEPAQPGSASAVSGNPDRAFPTLAPDRFKPYDLLGTPDGQAAYAAARTSAANDGIRLPSIQEIEDGATVPFQGWDHMKKVLQGQASEAARAGNNYRATQLTDIANGIRDETIKANPAYAEALETVAPGQRLAARLDRTGIGTIADQTGAESAKTILAPIFANSNPRAIAEARDAFFAAGRQDEWNAGVRAHLQGAWDTAATSQDGINPAMLRRQIWSNPDQKLALQAAMDPEHFRGLDNMMQVIEAVAKSRGMNSLTAPRLAGAKELEGMAASGSPGARVAGAASVALNPVQGVQVLGTVADKIQQALTKRNMDKIAERLFSPDGMSYLRAMANAHPGSERAASLTANLLGGLGGEAVGEAAGRER